MEIARLKACLLAATTLPSAHASPGTSLNKGRRYPVLCHHSISTEKPHPLFHSVLTAQMNSGMTGCPLLKEQQNGMPRQTEHLLQLAGHLKGKARQEYSLLPSDDKATFSSAMVAMRSWLDAGNRALAAWTLGMLRKVIRRQYLTTYSG